MENRGGFHGAFWRFLPVSEPGLDAVIIRDADSRLNVREAAAVAAWLKSGKAGHVMRDYPHHLSWPMLGGMWGIRGGVVADIGTRIANWGRWGKKLDDQHFLKEVVWPLIANDCVQHTSGYSRWGGEPFPAHGPCDSDYVGQPFYEGGRRDAVRRSARDDGRQSFSPELLLACVKSLSDRAAEAPIREILADFADWTSFARKAIDHGLAGVAATTLARVAADLVPHDILEALQVNRNQTLTKNRALLEELARLSDMLAEAGVEAIAFGDLVTAPQAYGDLGIRPGGELDFLVRKAEIAPTIAALSNLGYERKEQLTAAQFELMHHLRGRDVLFNESLGITVRPHTRLTPANIVLDIDYAAFWYRRQRTNLDGRSMLTLAPEDALLVLAIQGARELWWNIGRACDVAAFIGTHPKLAWSTTLERATAQGCLRMLLLATSLAHKCFDTPVPDTIVTAGSADSIIGSMVQRIVARWEADKPAEPASTEALPLDQLRLHDGAWRQARHVARALLLPEPRQVAAMALPSTLRFAYVPIRFVRAAVVHPLRRAYRQGHAQAARLLYWLAGSDLALTVIPAAAAKKLRTKRYENAWAAANRAVAVDPNDAAAWCKLGDALSDLKRHGEAVAYYDKALALSPSDQATSKKRAAAIKAIAEKGQPT
jgi:Uncharacterised nucleotidyltransferase/Tetratricopeptide repeat